ncbi:MAG: hypothetical protein AAB901_00765, partial [Patescibacteria group bacterium]
MGIGVSNPGNALTIARSGVIADLSVVTASDTFFHGAYLRAARARGTIASPNPVLADDVVFLIDATAYSNVAYQNTGSLRLSVDGSPNLSNVPGKWSFSTTNAGTGEAVRMVLDSNGR